MAKVPYELAVLIKGQDGMVARWQARRFGMSADAIGRRVRSGAWRITHPGVYATFTGRLDRPAQMWAALLHCSTWASGDGDLDAVLSHETAADLHGFAEDTSRVIHVTIPHGRRLPKAVAGVQVHVSRRLEQARHPALTPPRTRVEDTAVDLTQTARTIDDAINWLAVACGKWRTTPARLVAAIDVRKRLRWRAELCYALADVAEGSHNIFELRYHRNVERAHGLPKARRQRYRKADAQSQYDDVEYEDYDTIVHLDGKVHRYRERVRDRKRDNRAVVRGDDPLRFGWFDIDEEPCESAVDVATVLLRNGWLGTPRPCDRDCPVGRLT